MAVIVVNATAVVLPTDGTGKIGKNLPGESPTRGSDGHLCKPKEKEQRAMATGEGNQGRRRRRRRRSHSMFSLILNASPLHPSSPLLQRGEQQAAADRFKN
jgi:hypothetical protein